MKPPEHTNRLINETSPYLIQHAHNPVDWFPWGPEALQKASRENKPIFLSIGYSACHWCHVMERESFENEEIAHLLNDHFVSIKVDREERPDLDAFYMKSVQSMTGRGGWPLSVFLTPDLHPFYGGTYFPPEDLFNMPGFQRLLRAIHRAWTEEQDDLRKNAQIIQKRLLRVDTFVPQDQIPDESLLHDAFRTAVAFFDPQHGGFSQAPKFPQPLLLAFLLRYHHRTQNPQAEHILTRTLDRMAAGGIYDHLGGGFHRYSTDRLWLVPHFEKMLYDNALLSTVYLQSYQQTQNPDYARIARQILDYILREMTHPRGGFYSTQDADTQGEEGKYYVWTKDDILRVLNEEETRIFSTRYALPDDGNWEGKSILHAKTDLPSAAQHAGLSLPEFERRIDAIRQKLLRVRESRKPPPTDDKILTDWNGLMISAFCLGAQVLEAPEYEQVASRAARFILDHLVHDNRLYHTHRNTRSPVPAFLHDYAFFTAALIDLYETSFDPFWLRQADAFSTQTLSLFFDTDQAGFFTTAPDHTDLPTRQKDPFDAALPAGDSIAVDNLLRLAAFKADEQAKQTAARTFHLYRQTIHQHPTATASLLNALDRFLGPPVSVIIAGEKEWPSTQEAVRTVRFLFPPHAVIGRVDETVTQDDKNHFPLLRDKTPRGNRAAVYVCKHATCLEPITSTDRLRQTLLE